MPLRRAVTSIAAGAAILAFLPEMFHVKHARGNKKKTGVSTASTGTSPRLQ
ncbi:MAG TPA: hypothetical protein GXX34_04525 [Clostridia bacterium]|nr:hypothetical protein [Clostridia bacterium]